MTIQFHSKQESLYIRIYKWFINQQDDYQNICEKVLSFIDLY